MEAPSNLRTWVPLIGEYVYDFTDIENDVWYDLPITQHEHLTRIRSALRYGAKKRNCEFMSRYQKDDKILMFRFIPGMRSQGSKVLHL
jgi:hypothetical protein